MSLTIGVDVGGTKVAAGVVDGTGHVHAQLRRATPSQDAATVRRTIGAVVHALIEQVQPQPCVAVGLAAAGLVDAERELVRFAPHLPWREEPLRAALERDLGLPVILENDANAAAWAEWRFGSGQGEPRLVCLTVGTGIGGGMVHDGALQRGRWGMAGEFGHLLVVPDGQACACGNRGCLEAYVSGDALGRAARAAAAGGDPAAGPLVRRAGGDLVGLTGELVGAAAQAGDPLAIHLVRQVGTRLGQGLATVAAALDPGLFVIGGGVGACGDLLLEPARTAFAACLVGRGHRPLAPIRAATLGPLAGLVGAADLARQPPGSGA